MFYLSLYDSAPPAFLRRLNHTFKGHQVTWCGKSETSGGTYSEISVCAVTADSEFG